MRIRPIRLVSSLVLAATLVAMLVLTFGVTTRRWQAVPVLSGSMSPAIEAGALAVSVSVDRDQVSPGDVLIFRAPQGARSVTVHRVESATVEPGRLLLTTRGDANSATDPWGEFTISSAKVWRVTGSLAGVGRAVLWARTPTAQLIGFVALVGSAAIFLSDWRMARRRRRWARRHGASSVPAGETSLNAVETPPASEIGATRPFTSEVAPGASRSEPAAPRDARISAAAVRAIAATFSEPGEHQAGPMTDVTRLLDAIDPRWTWEPFATDADGSPAYERDADGEPEAFWLRLDIAETRRTGMATRREGCDDVRQSLVADALRFAATGLETRTVLIPESATTSKPRYGRAGVIATSLMLPVLLLGVGPGASATLTDRAVDTLTVGTRDLAPPQLTSAETEAALGSCQVTLTWTPSPTAGVDGYVFDRQPIAIGNTETDALGLTSPDPTGPWETVLRAEGGATTSAVDTLPDDQLQTASRFRYRSRATIGSWESADSNTVEAQALGTCLDDKALEKVLKDAEKELVPPPTEVAVTPPV